MKMETYADMYNTCDAIEKVSQTYEKNCRESQAKHANKALYGFLGTLGVALIGSLYTLIHAKSASYYGGAADVYERYTNIVEDCDKFEDEWKEMCER